MITHSGNNYYTIKDVQNRIGLCYSATYNMIKDQQVPMVKIGRRNYLTEEWFFKLTDVKKKPPIYI